MSELSSPSSCPRARDTWQGPAVIYSFQRSTYLCLHIPKQDTVFRGAAQCLSLYEGPTRDKVSNLQMYCSSHHQQQPFTSQITDYGAEETKKANGDWAQQAQREASEAWEGSTHLWFSNFSVRNQRVEGWRLQTHIEHLSWNPLLGDSFLTVHRLSLERLSTLLLMLLLQ